MSDAQYELDNDFSNFTTEEDEELIEPEEEEEDYEEGT